MLKKSSKTLTFLPNDILGSRRLSVPDASISAMKYGVPLVLSFLTATTNAVFSQENYVPPTYRESVAAQAQATSNNFVPVDQLFEAANGEMPIEPVHPYFDVDWSVLLSTTLTRDWNAETEIYSDMYAVSLTPEVSLTHVGLRGQYALDAQGVFSVNDNQLTRLNDIEFGYEGTYELESNTQLNSSATVTLNQDDVNAPGVSDTIVQTPYQLNLMGELGLVRQFGKFSLDASSQIERRYLSPTILTGNLEQNNAEFSFVKFGGSLRASYEFAPEIALFVQGDVARDWYDAAPIATGILRDGMDYGASGGAVVNWRDVLAVEGSAGYVVRQHMDASIEDENSVVYALNIDYNPTDAVSMVGNISTTIIPANFVTSRPKSLAYNASGTLGYAVSPTIGLRATQSGNWVFSDAGVVTQTTFATGFGVDVAVSKNLSVNLDYLYSWAEVLPTEDGPEHQHAGTIGIKYSR